MPTLVRRGLLACSFLAIVLAVAVSPWLNGEEPANRRTLSPAAKERSAELQTRIAQLNGAADYAEAIPLAEELVALHVEGLGADHHETISRKSALATLRKLSAASPQQRKAWTEAMLGVARALAESGPGSMEGTLAAYRKLLELGNEVFGPEHSDTALVRFKIADALVELGRNREAEEEFRQTLAVLRKTLGEKHPYTAMCCNALAAVLQERGDFDGAEKLFRSARAILVEAYGEAHSDTLTTLNNLGSNLYVRGRYREAETVHREVLAIRLKLYGERDPGTVMSRGNVAACVSNQGRYQEAEALYREALAGCRNVYGDEHGETARYLNALGNLLMRQNRASEGMAYFRQAVVVSRKVHGPAHPSTAGALNGLAFALDQQGLFAEAEPLFREALAIWEKVLGPKHHNTARGYNNLAHNLDNLGYYLEAEALLRRALAVWREVRGEHKDTATAMGNLANNLLFQSRVEEAEELARASLAIRRKVQGEQHLDSATCARQLASILAMRNQLGEAEDLLQNALPIIAKHLGKNHADFASALNALAIVQSRQGKTKEAEAIYRRALETYELARGEYHEDTANSRSNLGHNLLTQGRHDEAIECYLMSLQSFEAARLGAGTRGLDRTLFASKAGAATPHRRLCVTYAELGRHADAWRTLEGYFGRGLLDEVSARQQLQTPTDEKARLDALHARLAVLDAKIAAELAKDDAKDRVQQLAQERSELQTELVRSASELAQKAVFSLPKIQQAIPPDTALVAWLDLPAVGSSPQMPDDHWAFILRANQEPLALRLTGSGPQGVWTADDDELAGQVRAAVVQKLDSTKLADLLARLRQQRLEPLTEKLQGVRKLIVLPSRHLAGLPVELIADEYEVSYAPSGTLLAKLLEERPVGQARPAARSLLALGDPHFQAAKAMASAPPSERRRGPAPVPLPGTRKEIEAIAALFPQAEKLLGADASTTRLAELESKLQEFDVLHLATHGVADPAVAFRSYLVLASAAEDEGRLQASAIRERWKLRAELVVLSACDSGLGRYAGGEGYLGFAQPLFLAGARSLVLSQWQVSDAATALLMVRFYENWLGQRGGQPMTKSAALREAKKWLRTLSRADVEHRLASLPEAARGLKLEPAGAANPRTNSDRPFEHPYYWSAFILIGEPN